MNPIGENPPGLLMTKNPFCFRTKNAAPSQSAVIGPSKHKIVRSSLSFIEFLWFEQKLVAAENFSNSKAAAS
jgi:hypothetical protein